MEARGRACLRVLLLVLIVLLLLLLLLAPGRERPWRIAV
jgi:hypothetical protein